MGCRHNYRVTDIGCKKGISILEQPDVPAQLSLCPFEALGSCDGAWVTRILAVLDRSSFGHQ